MIMNDELCDSGLVVSMGWTGRGTRTLVTGDLDKNQ